jgi:translation initiation factor IF-3
MAENELRKKLYLLKNWLQKHNKVRFKAVFQGNLLNLSI